MAPPFTQFSLQSRKTLVFRVGNLSHDGARPAAQRAKKERLLEQFGVDLLAPAPPAEPGVDREQLSRCVQNLNERERTVIVMTLYDEQTGADLAQFMGVSEANVRVIRHRAIHQLRNFMGVTA